MVTPRHLLSRRMSAPARVAGALILVVAALLAVAPAARAAEWSSPFVLEPGLGLFEQYGYAPSYIRHVPAFDSTGRAYIRSRTTGGESASYVHTPGAAGWVRLDFRAALLAAYPDFVTTVGAGGLRSDRVVFDSQDRAYNPLTIRLSDGQTRNVLMVSRDLCRSWRVYELPAGDFTVEHWVGHNEIDGPPFLAFWTPSPLPYAGHRGGRFTLWVTQPRLEGDELVIPTPAHVTDSFLGLGRDSGGASMAVTHDDSTWFVWAATNEAGVRGVPQYISRYDHTTGAVDAPLLLTATAPVNDPHNTPGICIDSQGYLHVVGGTHGTAVPYLRSLMRYSSSGGWTPPRPVLSAGYANADDPPQHFGRQTYDAFVCDSRDTLHLVTRQWRRSADGPFPGKYYGALVHQGMPASGAWGEPTVIVVADAPGYAIFYHKLALDHRDRLFVSCSYYGGEQIWEDRARGAARDVLGRSLDWRSKYRRRMVLVSDDAGADWRFATDADFAAQAPPASAASRASTNVAGDPSQPPIGLTWASPSPQGNQLTALAVPGAKTAWAVGTGGTVLRTVDAGVTWKPQATPAAAGLFGLTAVDTRTAWAVGEGGLVLRTSDGGRTWRTGSSGTTRTLFAVTAVTARRAWAVGARGLILTTGDAGATWRRTPAGMFENLFSIDFIDALHGWAAGRYGYILHTADGGRTWRPQATGTTTTLYGIDFYDSLHGLAVGARGLALRTADGGRTWTKGRSRVATQLNAVRMASPRSASASGAGGVTLASADGGRTWRVRRLPTGGMLGALAVAPGGAIWTAGAGGALHRSLDGGDTWARLGGGSTVSLNAVATDDAARLWVAGRGGHLARLDGGIWTDIALGAPVAATGLAVAGADLWVVGDAGLVARSADSGKSWSRRDTLGGGRLAAVAALGGGRAFVVGALGTLLATDDGGQSWLPRDVAPDDLTCITFLDAAHAWAGGGAAYGESRAVVLRSIDGGIAWERIEAPVQGRVFALAFTDADRGWAVAEDWGVDGDEARGAILATADGGRSWVRQADSAAVLTSLSMSPAGIGWAFGGAGAALATVDGGASWQAVASGTDNTLRACALPSGWAPPLGALPGPIGWVVGDDGTVLQLTATAP